jgi:spore maturation protein CgeB
MTEYMRRLLDSRKMADEMGEKAKVRVRENYSLSKHLEKLSEVITHSVA